MVLYIVAHTPTRDSTLGQFIKRLPGFISRTFSISRGGRRIIGAVEDWDPPLLETPSSSARWFYTYPHLCTEEVAKCVWGVAEILLCRSSNDHTEKLHYIFAHLVALQSLSLSAAISGIIEWEYYWIEIVIENFTPALGSFGVVSIKSISLHFIANTLDAFRCKL